MLQMYETFMAELEKEPDNTAVPICPNTNSSCSCLVENSPLLFRTAETAKAHHLLQLPRFLVLLVFLLLFLLLLLLQTLFPLLQIQILRRHLGGALLQRLELLLHVAHSYVLHAHHVSKMVLICESSVHATSHVCDR